MFRPLLLPLGVLLLVLVLVGLTPPAGAAVYCVNSAATITNALTEAAGNNADDEIRIVQGTYLGKFVYESSEANALSIQGGYTAGCSSRTLDPANTTLDSYQSGTVLTLSAPGVAAQLSVQGLTLRNGKSDFGGGLHAEGVIMIERNRITGNTARSSSDYQGYGGGVYVSGTVTLTNNYIQDNTASGKYGYGGGALVSGTVTLTNNYIQGNTASGYVDGYGGGVFVYPGGMVTLTNNYIQGNTASGSDYGYGYGGGVYASSTVTLTNNTLVGNTSKGSGGGLFFFGDVSDSAFLYNNIFWDNTTDTNRGADLTIHNDNDGQLPVALMANNFDQSESGFLIEIPIYLDPSNLNALDPLFVDADNGDLHLTEGSPMIDAGYPQTPDLPETDLDGKPRVQGAAVDIGAYEYGDSGAPDFRVTRILLTPASPTNNTTFNAKITVKNQGTVAGVPGMLQVWTNQRTKQSCRAVGDASAKLTKRLNPGASISLTLQGLNAGAAGSRTFRAFVDSECKIEESLETNNQSTKNYTVKSPLPDFVVTGIVLQPTSPKAKGLLSAAITIKNQGTVSGDAGYLDLWTNQATSVTCGTIGNAWASVGTLAPNESKTLTISGLRGEAAGTKTLRTFVDSWCETDETNNANNQKAKAYTVQR